VKSADSDTSPCTRSTARHFHIAAASAHAERRQALKLAGLSQAAIGKLRGMNGAIDIVVPAAGVQTPSAGA